MAVEPRRESFFLPFVFRLLVGVFWEALSDLFNVSVWLCGFAEKCSERGRHVGQRQQPGSSLQKDPFVSALSPLLTALKDDIDAEQRHRKPARLINQQVC